MSHRNDPGDAEFRASLPPELQQLDKELSAIRIEERSSFAPELEGELIRAWKAMPAERSAVRPFRMRTLLAAGLAGLMVAGVSVPSARAAIADLARTVQEAVAPLFGTPAEVQLPEIQIYQPAPIIPEVGPEVVSPPPRRRTGGGRRGGFPRNQS
ncbi:hypothetical protein ACFL5A_04650 [Gemmatimonadota bacterium]